MSGAFSPQASTASRSSARPGKVNRFRSPSDEPVSAFAGATRSAVAAPPAPNRQPPRVGGDDAAVKTIRPEGVYATYARIAESVADARLRLYLYHIPQVSGVAIPDEAIARLQRAYPTLLAGVKDSECNLAHSLRLLEAFPQLSIFVGFEPHLPAALAGGGAGTICGIANLYPRLIRRLFDHAGDASHRPDLTILERFIAVLDSYPLFPAFKALQADLTGDTAWNVLRPPLMPLESNARDAWLAAVAACGIARSDATDPH